MKILFYVEGRGSRETGRERETEGMREGEGKKEIKLY